MGQQRMLYIRKFYVVKTIYIYIYIYKNKLSVCGWMDLVTSPEKTGSGDVKTEKTKKRQKLQKKTKN